MRLLESYARYCIANERFLELKTGYINGMVQNVYFKSNGETKIWNVKRDSVISTINSTMDKLDKEFGLHDINEAPRDQHVGYIIAYDMGKTIDMYVGESGNIKGRLKQHQRGDEMLNVKLLFLAAREKGINEIAVFITGAFETRQERKLEQRNRIVQAVFSKGSKRFQIVNSDASTRDGSIKVVHNV